MNFLEIKLQYRNLLRDAAALIKTMGMVEVRALRSLVFTIMMILSFTLIGVAPGSVEAATYYIDGSNGNDSANGSQTSPWRTLNKANRSAKAGDSIIIKAGTYSGQINPQNSGNNGNPITFTNNGSDEVLIAGSGSATPVILAKNYIAVKGLQIKTANPPSGQHTNNVLIYGDYNSITDCQIVGDNDVISEHSSGRRETGIFVAGGMHNRIENNIIKNMSYNGIKLERANRSIVRNNEVVDNYMNSVSLVTNDKDFSGILIENNQLGRNAVSDGIQFNPNFDSSDYSNEKPNQGVIIRGNTIFDSAENGIDLKGTAHILIEDNIIFGGIGNNDGNADNNPDRMGGLGGITKGTVPATEDIIIRRNILYDNLSAIQLFDGWKVYNNTILGNNRDFTGSNSTFTTKVYPQFVGIMARWGVSRVAVKNNIIAGHNSGEICIATTDVQAEIDNNLYYNDSQTYLVDFKSKGNWSKQNLQSWQKTLGGRNNIVGNDQNSIVAPPNFSSNMTLKPTGLKTKDEFSLNSNSAAVDKGGPLTITTNSGSGNIIYVKDAGYFCDGFNAVDGDMIKVGSNNAVKITSVDYGQNMIVVDGKLTWNKGDTISLNYNGKNPDIGALELAGSVASDEVPSPSLRIVVTNDE